MHPKRTADSDTLFLCVIRFVRIRSNLNTSSHTNLFNITGDAAWCLVSFPGCMGQDKHGLGMRLHGVPRLLLALATLVTILFHIP